MNTLIKYVTAITLDKGEKILRDAPVVLEVTEIVALGDTPSEFEPDELIDGRERVALPGFFNAHCHAAMTLERGWAASLPFDRWLHEKIWVAESKRQVDNSLEAHGKTPVAHLDRLGVFDVRGPLHRGQ
jgi:5-methylthioadenosine/S-adenosylhomocysteine deaminase